MPDVGEPASAAETTGYRPKPPLWQSSSRSPLTLRRGILGAGGIVLLVGVMSSPWLEKHFLVTIPQLVVVRILAVEGTNPGDDTSQTTVRYLIGLPDGTKARFVSENTHPVGTRLKANTARSRVTGRVFVVGPYKVLAE